MRKLAFCILSVGAVFIITGYLLPSSVHVKREVRINAPIAAVYWKVSDLKQWTEWSGLVPTDPPFQLEYFKSEYDTDTGFCWQTGAFNGQKRRLLVTGSSFCDSLSTTMSFDKDDIANSSFRFREQNGESIVSWEFETSLGNDILSRWKGLFVGQIIGPDMKKSLNKLKTISENTTSRNPLQITELNKN